MAADDAVIGVIGGVQRRPGGVAESAVALHADTGPSGSTPTAVEPTQGNRGM
jgi:hypothetical protein